MQIGNVATSDVITAAWAGTFKSKVRMGRKKNPPPPPTMVPNKPMMNPNNGKMK
jgi:hypothetical protein